ncbi:MAG: TIGR03905 family TSCPD domain-containing protein [Mycoplasmataceae bacterium]|jgi:uncharacterized protein (TIGR03905 family)|nr:TIGR03905 family TSCPD domain-containing protein [Mycoplasmataceae bacterium]
MKYSYKPQGVCSREFIFEIEGDKVLSFQSIGGCPGNLLGIASLLKGMNIDEIIAKFTNVKCGTKETSCPDQIAKALKSYKESKK